MHLRNILRLDIGIRRRLGINMDGSAEGAGMARFGGDCGVDDTLFNDKICEVLCFGAMTLGLL
jgi:hypothetical protein